MVKQLFRSVAYSSCWEPVWDLVRDFGAVMMLHSVSRVDPNGLEENQSLRTSPERLDRFLMEARRKGFAFVSMDEIVETLASGKKIGKRLALTADDGYLDNFTAALPVVKAHDAPLCVFLSTGLMQGETIAWWNRLERQVLSQERLELPDGRSFACGTPAERLEAFRQARWWIQKIPFEELNGALASFFGVAADELLAESRGDYIRLDRLSAYADEPLLTLGAHTHWHFACENLTVDAFRANMETNLRLLSAVGVRPRHFAYPYGRDPKMAARFAPTLRELGFVSASVTRPDVLMRGMDPFAIPRLVLSEYPQDTQLPYVALARRTILGKV